jgi:SanA protein
VLLAIPFLARAGEAVAVRGRLFSAATVAPRHVAIVFGARVFPGGYLSNMLADRVATGADLYRQGKAQVLLMTGDNSTLDYNEPEAMKRQAIGLGVPAEAIVLDYAGRRTYDSCYRAKHIFQLEQAILVTQAFHLDRALLLCNALGVEAVGIPADTQRPQGYRLASITYSQIRELPAAVAAWLDLLRRPVPILGPALPIVNE